MPAWTFITNHGAVLALIAQHIQITTREIASELGITERSVHRIIFDLESEGYIEKSRAGRINRYAINHDLPLRRPERVNTLIGELIKTLLPGDLEGNPPPAIP